MDYPHSTVESSIDVESGLSPLTTVLRQMSADGPGQVNVGLANTSTDQVKVSTGAPRLFDGLLSTRGPSKLWLFPVVDTLGMTSDAPRPMVPDRDADGCWRHTDGVVQKDVLSRTYLDPGVSMGRDYVLLEHGTDTCFPRGRYEFETEIGTEDVPELGWSVDVTLSDVTREA